MREFGGFNYADEGEPVSLKFDTPVPTNEELVPSRNDRLILDASRKHYSLQARTIVYYMMRHLPGGLVDAIFGELCYKKASVFRVAHLNEDNDE